MSLSLEGISEWFDKLPQGWSAVRIKHGFGLIGSGTTPPTSEARYYDGTVPWVNTSELRENVILSTEKTLTREALEEFSTLRIYPVGTILFAMYGATIGRVAILGIPSTVNQAVCALAEPNRFVPRFAFYGLQVSREVLAASSSGGGQPNLNAEKVREHELPCPDLKRQSAIADYLDRETARLDALVAAKERVLGLLAERRRAIITHVVTRGLSAKVPVRDSGIPWLGEIPEHWETWKLGHLAVVGNGSTPNRDNQAYWSEGSIPWLNSSVVNEDEVTNSDQFVTTLALHACHLPLVEPGSVLIGITGQGKTRGRAVVLSFEATINQHLAFITPRTELLDAWYLRWFLFAAYEFLRSISDDAGGTKGALTCEEVAALRVPLPPIAEQRTIVRYIATESKRLDRVRDATECTIMLLRERRAAFIAAAVTGKIEVGGTAWSA